MKLVIVILSLIVLAGAGFGVALFAIGSAILFLRENVIDELDGQEMCGFICYSIILAAVSAVITWGWI